MARRLQVARDTTFEMPRDAAKFAKSLSDAFLDCRQLGHVWKPHRASWHQDEGHYDRVIRCTRCKAERHEWLDVLGEVVSRVYIYPAGYQHKGLGRLTTESRNALRLESLIRMIGTEASATGAS